MRALAIALLVGVFVAHDTANWLGENSKFSPAAWFYMLQGAWTALLSACVLGLLYVAKPSVWRSLAVAAMGISIVAGLMVPVCRLAVADINAVPRGVSLCNHVTGLPIGAAILCVEVFVVCWIIGQWVWKNGDGA